MLKPPKAAVCQRIKKINRLVSVLFKQCFLPVRRRFKRHCGGPRRGGYGRRNRRRCCRSSLRLLRNKRGEGLQRRNPRTGLCGRRYWRRCRQCNRRRSRRYRRRCCRSGLRFLRNKRGERLPGRSSGHRRPGPGYSGPNRQISPAGVEGSAADMLPGIAGGLGSEIVRPLVEDHRPSQNILRTEPVGIYDHEGMPVKGHERRKVSLVVRVGRVFHRAEMASHIVKSRISFPHDAGTVLMYMESVKS